MISPQSRWTLTVDRDSGDPVVPGLERHPDICFPGAYLVPPHESPSHPHIVYRPDRSTSHHRVEKPLPLCLLESVHNTAIAKRLTLAKAVDNIAPVGLLDAESEKAPEDAGSAVSALNERWRRLLRDATRKNDLRTSHVSPPSRGARAGR